MSPKIIFDDPLELFPKSMDGLPIPMTTYHAEVSLLDSLVREWLFIFYIYPARPINDNANEGKNPLHTEGLVFTTIVPIPIGWEVKDGKFIKHYSKGWFRFIGAGDVVLYWIRTGSRYVTFTVNDKDGNQHTLTFYHLLVAETPKNRPYG